MNLRFSITTACAAALLVATACAGPSKRASGGGYTSAPAPSNGGGAAAETAGDYDSGSYDSGSTTATRPQERPGLGTVWGENLTSHVNMKSFVRAAHSPFAAITLHYNDAEGVRAHTSYLGNYQLQPIRAYTPHGGISVAVTDQYGRLLPGGTVQGRTMVVGSEGARYNLVVENKTGGRYEVVASVDGLDVIDGRPADLVKRGYIIEPYGSLVIDGFRRSDSTVAAFRFGKVSQSYAARTSGDRNVGVVGVALFAERGSVWTTDELRRRDNANPFPGDHSYARPPNQ